MLVPAVVGVYVTLITQFVVGCSATFVQLSVSAKSPLALILENVIGTGPLFVAVTDSALLVTPTCCCPNARFDADSVNVEVVPVKLRT